MSLKNEFVTYEQALALKELGFDDSVIGFYSHNNPHFEPGYLHMSTEHMFSDNIVITKQREFCISAPTYSQAFRWFRDLYNIYHIILPSYGDNKKKIKDKFFFEIAFNNKIKQELEYHKNHELAEQACLNKLIEIVKNEKDI